MRKAVTLIITSRLEVAPSIIGLECCFFFLNDNDFMKFKYIYTVLAIEALEFGHGA